MSDRQSASLRVRAMRLTSLARQAREGAEAVQDHTRVETALSKLDSNLRALEAAVKLEDRLVKRGVKAATEFDLIRAPRELRQHIASVGRPGPQLLTARANDVAKATKILTDSAVKEWTAWANRSLTELPVDRVLRLGITRSRVEFRLEALNRLASASPTVESVEDFLAFYEFVASELDAVAPLGPLDDLLARLPCRLSELTDEDLRLLRLEHPHVGERIVLRAE